MIMRPYENYTIHNLYFHSLIYQCHHSKTLIIDVTSSLFDFDETLSNYSTE